jgi:hypothetical protein
VSPGYGSEQSRVYPQLRQMSLQWSEIIGAPHRSHGVTAGTVGFGGGGGAPGPTGGRGTGRPSLGSDIAAVRALQQRSPRGSIKR